MTTLKVALLGCGNVGSEVYRLLGEQAGDLGEPAGPRGIERAEIGRRLVGAVLPVAGTASRSPEARSDGR